MPELLIPFMPLFASLPFVVAATWIAHRWLRSRERMGLAADEVVALRAEVDALQQARGEIEERLDFTERMLGQLREGLPQLPQPGATHESRTPV